VQTIVLTNSKGGQIISYSVSDIFEGIEDTPFRVGNAF